MGLIAGFYDGIFGPGTGSFMTLGFVLLFGLGVTRAAAHTKVLNLTSNLAALALFMVAGDVLWPAAIAMAIGQIAGGYLGAMTGNRFGARLIRPLVVLVSVVLALRLLLTGDSRSEKKGRPRRRSGFRVRKRDRTRSGALVPIQSERELQSRTDFELERPRGGSGGVLQQRRERRPEAAGVSVAL